MHFEIAITDEKGQNSLSGSVAQPRWVNLASYVLPDPAVNAVGSLPERFFSEKIIICDCPGASAIAFPKSVDKLANCWFALHAYGGAFRRYGGMCIETKNGAYLDFDTLYELPFDHVRCQDSAQSTLAAL